MSRDERSATPGADGVRRSVILAAMRWCVVLVLAACGRIGFDATTDAGPMGPCPSGYDLIAGHCYRSVEVGAGGERSWLDAEEECEADGPGAHLAVIDDAEEAQRFTEGMVEQDSWIGISDRITEGTFITVTGAAVHGVGRGRTQRRRRLREIQPTASCTSPIAASKKTTSASTTRSPPTRRRSSGTAAAPPPSHARAPSAARASAACDPARRARRRRRRA